MRIAEQLPQMNGEWDSLAWSKAETLELLHFRPEGSKHRPKTSVRLLYDNSGLFGIFRVRDRYVRAIHTRYGAPVFKDSCVEFFVKPGRGKGYFNFEFNCGGTFLSSYITNSERTSDGFREFVCIAEDDARCVAAYHSLPDVVDPEILVPVTWTLEFFIPFTLLRKYAGPLGELQDGEWRANFYKCGDETSHPHWASWQPVPELNFHMPEYFGAISFERS
ncbi:MAG TPA: carbohydrate-binding family 9-like protein [Dissulfurispiraceae bacterium]|nr:carbohydrate-binding family 9-like protein [Dissulfurispiraceae bacterium]